MGLSASGCFDDAMAAANGLVDAAEATGNPFVLSVALLAELGFPISRGAIAQIESNSRSGKVDVAELFVLSAALDIPPVLLLFMVFPSGNLMEVLPDVEVMAEDAVRWVSGRISFPQKVGPAGFEDGPKPLNDGVRLVAAALSVEKALEARVPLVNQLEKAADPGEREVAQRTLQIQDEQIEGMLKEIRDAQGALWGFQWASDSDELERESDD